MPSEIIGNESLYWCVVWVWSKLNLNRITEITKSNFVFQTTLRVLDCIVAQVQIGENPKSFD